MWKLSLEKVQPPRFGFIQINLLYFLFFVVKVFASHKLFDLPQLVILLFAVIIPPPPAPHLYSSMYFGYLYIDYHPVL